MTPEEKFNAEVSEWLDTPPEQADPVKGIDLLFRLTGNAIQRARLSVNPHGNAGFVRQTLRNLHTFRLEVQTRREFAALSAKADKAMKRHLDTKAPEGVRPLPYGKRPDHEDLPREVRELFDLNMQGRRRMAECHMQMRAIYKARPKCMESELYPWVKEIIRLDKQVLERWSQYDNYKPEP